MVNILLKNIAKLDLGSFKRPFILGDRNYGWRAAWYLVNALVFQSTLGSLIPSRLKAAVLRLFGAEVGPGLVCKPRVNLKSPWFVRIGSNVWLGEGVWIDNQCLVDIRSNVCISQGSYIFTGNHDWTDPAFKFFCKPIVINEGAWVTAFQVIGPGTAVPPATAVMRNPKAERWPGPSLE